MATLFTQPFLLQQAEAALTQLLEETAPLPLLCITGLPVALDNRLYNTAVVFCRGQILGAVPKSYLPNYNEFYENRWFAPGTESHAERISLCGQETPFSTRLLFECGDVCLGVEICEDLWVPGASLIDAGPCRSKPVSQYFGQQRDGRQTCLPAFAYRTTVGPHDGGLPVQLGRLQANRPPTSYLPETA